MPSKLISFTRNLKKFNNILMVNAIKKITVLIYLISVQYMNEVYNADNARKFRIWFDNQLHEIYARNNFSIASRRH